MSGLFGFRRRLVVVAIGAFAVVAFAIGAQVGGSAGVSHMRLAAAVTAPSTSGAAAPAAAAPNTTTQPADAAETGSPEPLEAPDPPGVDTGHADPPGVDSVDATGSQ